MARAKKNTEVTVEEVTVVTEPEVTENVVVEEATVVENVEKKNEFLDITAIVALYEEYGIRVANPSVKGNYRIMGHKKGSSLNLKPKKGYYIYTTDEDYANISSSGLKADDLLLEEGTNPDPSRHNIVACTTESTLRELLQLYAMNPANKVVTEAVAQ